MNERKMAKVNMMALGGSCLAGRVRREARSSESKHTNVHVEWVVVSKSDAWPDKGKITR